MPRICLTTSILIGTLCTPALAQPTDRLLAFISDLHIGVGRIDGEWDRKEDFRWPKALAGLLDHVSAAGSDQVDLVIVGDFLELWQPPADIDCAGPSAELGCTVEQVKSITERVIAGHPDAFAALRDFARRGANRLHLIPGNHDSALLFSPVWEVVARTLGNQDRVALVANGVWTSDDGRIVVEHGHQIGADANRYDDWSQGWRGISRDEGGETYIIRPWGERFVQRLFNEEEDRYPVIDNLSPEAAGARYRLSDRGLWGSIKDLARFVSFNLWETSLNQKGQFLGRQQDETGRPIWSVKIARQLGHKLIAGALPADDPFRAELLADNDDAAALRAEMDALVADADRLSDEEARLLCDLLAIRRSADTCDDPTLGYTLEKALIPREWVIRKHLEDRLGQYPRMKTFIYGHTHKYETKWRVDVTSLSAIHVMNTGAFQRLIDDEEFVALAKSRDMTPSEGLRELSPDDLKPCYTVVLVPYQDGFPEPKLHRWHMPEDGTGRLLEPGTGPCR